MDITQILRTADSGDSEARGELIQAVYQDLRALAGRQMSNERQNQTLSATALVHEVSMKILGENDIPTEGRGQFFAYAAKAMRNYLIDHARTRGRQKRGGDRKRVIVEEAMIASEQRSEDLLALNEALRATSGIGTAGKLRLSKCDISAACPCRKLPPHWRSPSPP